MRSLVLAAAVLAAAPPPISLPDAARAGDRAAVVRLLQGKADPNAAQPDGTTALHWAAHLNDVEAARRLVEAGADVRAANHYGETPLSLSCAAGGTDLVRLLLDKGADANGVLPGGETMLMVAARTGRVEAVNALLRAGADVNATEPRKGQTALMWAAAEGHGEVTGALLAAGAKRDARLDSGYNAFLFAAREGRIGVVRTLLRAGANVNDTVQPGTVSGRKFAQVPRGPRAGTSALMLAVTNGHFSLASVLLDAGADPNADGPGLTALHLVTNYRHPGVGDNDPAPDGSGDMTSVAFVRKIAAKGADLNARMKKQIPLGMTRINTIGATPFFMAAKTADAELMRLLVELGADPRINNADNSTALMAAAGLGTRSPGEDAGTEDEVLEAIEVALSCGIDINAVDDNGETAMHAAAYKNSPKAVERLAVRGAKLEIWNRENKQGWTPLRIAEGYRFGNFKPSLVTVAAIRKLLDAPKP